MKYRGQRGDLLTFVDVEVEVKVPSMHAISTNTNIWFAHLSNCDHITLYIETR